MTFTRGTVVEHKVMGRGIVLNEVEENGETKVEVRMENGVPQKFYPEELESEEVIKERHRQWAEEANSRNKKRFGL